MGGGKMPTITTNLAHRTSSYGLPHVLVIYEKDNNIPDSKSRAPQTKRPQGGGQKVGALTASYWKGYDTVGDRAYVIELYKK